MTPRFELKTDNTVYDRVIRWCLLLAVGLIPIFFLPLTTDPVEMNKIALFAVLMCVATGAWLLRAILTRAPVKRVPVAIPLLAYLLCAVLATVFSWYRYRSLVGETGSYAHSLISTILFVAFFFFLTQTVQKRDLPKFLGALLISGALLLLFNFFQVFGWFLFPWSFTQGVNFSALANSPMTFSFFAAFIGLLAFMKFLRLQALEEKTRRLLILRSLLIPLMVLSLFMLMVYDNAIGWYAVIVGLVLILVAVNIATKTTPPTYFVLPALVLGIALLGLFLNTQALLQASIQSDVQLPADIGWDITWDALKSRPLFGSGQTTFSAVFAHFRPVAYNDTNLVGLRFAKSSNEWFQLIATIGILGTIAFAAVLLFALIRQWRTLRSVQLFDPWWWYHVGIFIGTFLLVGLTFFTAGNVVLFLLLWLFLGAGVIVEELRPQPTVRTGQSSEVMGSALVSLVFAVFVVTIVVFAYYGGRWFAADVQSGKANAMVARQENLENIRGRLSSAVMLNPSEQRYHFELAQNLLVQAQIAAQAQQPDVNQIRTLLSAALTSAAAGASRYTNYSGTQEAYATIGAAVDALIGEISPATEEAFTKARENEPNNPGLALGFGQIYLTRAQSLQGDEKKTERNGFYEKALAQYEAARKLQTNPIQATLNAGLVLRLLGKGNEAIAMLEELVKKNPTNVDVLFNLAEQYRIDTRDDDAAVQYRSIVNIFPGHSDSHFRLGEIAQKKGDKETARAEFDIVLQLNPGSEDVKAKLEALK